MNDYYIADPTWDSISDNLTYLMNNIHHLSKSHVEYLSYKEFFVGDSYLHMINTKILNSSDKQKNCQ